MFLVHSKVWCIAMQRFKVKNSQIKRIIVMKVTRPSWHCSAWVGIFYFSKLRLMLKLVSSIRRLLDLDVLLPEGFGFVIGKLFIFLSRLLYISSMALDCPLRQSTNLDNIQVFHQFESDWLDLLHFLFEWTGVHQAFDVDRTVWQGKTENWVFHRGTFTLKSLNLLSEHWWMSHSPHSQ